MDDRLLSKNQARISHWPIAALRIYTGIFFAFNGFRKLFNDGFPNGMIEFLKRNAENSPAFYQNFVEAVVIPNSGLFAGLVIYSEVLIGVALVLGLATRYAAIAGALLVTNFWLAKGQSVLDGSNHDVVWLVIFLVLALVPAGKIAGLDDGLSDRYRFLR